MNAYRTASMLPGGTRPLYLSVKDSVELDMIVPVISRMALFTSRIQRAVSSNSMVKMMLNRMMDLQLRAPRLLLRVSLVGCDPMSITYSRILPATSTNVAYIAERT